MIIRRTSDHNSGTIRPNWLIFSDIFSNTIKIANFNFKNVFFFQNLPRRSPPSELLYFVPIYCFQILSFLLAVFLCFFVLFHSCCLVLMTTFKHEFFICCSLTEWYTCFFPKTKLPRRWYRKIAYQNVMKINETN